MDVTAAGPHAVGCLRVSLALGLIGVAVALPAAAGAAPAPDAAPNSPSVAPDPVPGGGSAPPTEAQNPSRPSAPLIVRQAPSAVNSRPTTPPARRPTATRATPMPRHEAARRSAPARHPGGKHAASRRRQLASRKPEPATLARPSRIFARVSALVQTGSATAARDDASGLMAAGALLTLVLAGASMLGLTARLPAGRA